MAASWRPPTRWAVDAEPMGGSVKNGQVEGAVAGSRRLWWGGAGRAAFLAAFDVPVVQVVDVGFSS